MAHVEAVFELHDRMSARLARIEAVAKRTERTLHSLDRAVEGLMVRLELLGKMRVSPTITADIDPLKRKVIEARVLLASLHQRFPTGTFRGYGRGPLATSALIPDEGRWRAGPFRARQRAMMTRGVLTGAMEPWALRQTRFQPPMMGGAISRQALSDPAIRKHVLRTLAEAEALEGRPIYAQQLREARHNIWMRGRSGTRFVPPMAGGAPWDWQRAAALGGRDPLRGLSPYQHPTLQWFYGRRAGTYGGRLPGPAGRGFWAPTIAGNQARMAEAVMGVSMLHEPELAARRAAFARSAFGPQATYNEAVRRGRLGIFGRLREDFRRFNDVPWLREIENAEKDAARTAQRVRNMTGYGGRRTRWKPGGIMDAMFGHSLAPGGREPLAGAARRWFGSSAVANVVGAMLFGAGGPMASILGAAGLTALAGGPALAAGLAAGGLFLANPAVRGARQAYQRVGTLQQQADYAVTPKQRAAALQKMNAVLKSLDPTTKALVKSSLALKKAWDDVNKPITKTVANATVLGRRALARGLQIAGPAIQGFAGVGERLMQRASNWMNQPATAQRIQASLAPLPHIAELGGMGLGRMAIAAMGLSTAISPLTAGLLEDLDRQLNAAANAAQDPKTVARWSKEFMRFKPLIESITGLLWDLGKGLWQLAKDFLPTATDVVNMLRHELLPTLLNTIDTFSRLVAPTVVPALALALRVLNAMLTALNITFKVLGPALNKIISFFNWLDKATGGLATNFMGLILTTGLLLRLFSRWRVSAGLVGVALSLLGKIPGMSWLVKMLERIIGLNRTVRNTALAAGAAENAMGASISGPARRPGGPARGGGGGVGGWIKGLGTTIATMGGGTLLGTSLTAAAWTLPPAIVAATIALGLTGNLPTSERGRRFIGAAWPQAWGPFRSHGQTYPGGAAGLANIAALKKRQLGGLSWGPTLVGESGHEMVIPLGASHRKRALGLMAQTNRMLGGGGATHYGPILEMSGSININSGHDYKQFMGDIEDHVQRAAALMPHFEAGQTYTGG